MFREQYGEIKRQNQTSKASLDIALVGFIGSKMSFEMTQFMANA